MHKHLALFAVLLTIASCATQSSKNPQKTAYNDADIETIAVLGTNDIHGGIAPMALKTKDAQATPYTAGGVAYLASYVKKLRSEWGDRLLWLDAGDEFQGTIESNSNHGATMVRFFNLAGVNAAAIGNHEFDYGAEPSNPEDRLGILKTRMSEAHYPYLSANLLNRDGSPASLPNLHPSTLFRAGSLKVGVIGLSTVSTPTTTRPENISSLKFANLKEATLRESQKLRSSGADVVLVVAHVGLFCDLRHSQPGAILRKPNDPQGECASDDEMVRLLESLPSGTIDGVVSGHTHSVVHHWVGGVPVIQGGANGRYINLIRISYDRRQRRVVPELSRIEGPIPVCPMVFGNQGDCNGDRPAPSIGRGALATPVFHGEKIQADSATETVIAPALLAAKKVESEIYGQAARRIEHERFKESPMGDLVSDAIRNAAKSDFALMNSGGIRTHLESGPITYGAIFRALPFDNSIVVLTVTGKQLKQILRVGESGSRGFHAVSGLKLRLLSSNADAPSDDLNGDRKIEPWEINRLIEVRTTNGDPIEDGKTYTLATIDYLVSGGDDYAWPMSQVPNPDKKSTTILLRDAAAAYIRKLTDEQGSINSESHPLVETASPRMVFEKSKATKSKKKHHRKRKRRSRNALH